MVGRLPGVLFLLSPSPALCVRLDIMQIFELAFKAHLNIKLKCIIEYIKIIYVFYINLNETYN